MQAFKLLLVLLLAGSTPLLLADEHEDTHADITAVYRFTCAHPEALDRVEVRLFDHFPMTERLQVQYITEEHQGAAGLTASQSVVRF